MWTPEAGWQPQSRQSVHRRLAPGPEGIAPTNPSASPPALIAISASSMEAIQQIFTRVRIYTQSDCDQRAPRRAESGSLPAISLGFARAAQLMAVITDG